MARLYPRLLPNGEPEASDVIASVFEKEGIKVIPGRVESVRSEGAGCGHAASCRLSNGSIRTVPGDLLLVAAGRDPVTSGMNLEGIGVMLRSEGGGGVSVDDKLRTSARGVYAAGDCTGDRQFTHYAGYQGAVAARNALLPLTDPGVLGDVPSTTFTDPEVAEVGMTEAQAVEQYGEGAVEVAVQLVKDVDRAICDGATDGVIKVVYRKRNYQILGASIVSPTAGEMISEISVAMKTGLTFDMLATVMHTYPSYSFALQSMAANVYYKKLLKSKGILSFLKKLGL